MLKLLWARFYRFWVHVPIRHLIMGRHPRLPRIGEWQVRERGTRSWVTIEVSCECGKVFYRRVGYEHLDLPVSAGGVRHLVSRGEAPEGGEKG